MVFTFTEQKRKLELADFDSIGDEEMHYHAEIWIPPNIEDAKEYIDTILKPYSEHVSADGFLDWYQIGGRWTGCHDPSYDPEKDPRNIETCRICNGTGFRTDAIGTQLRLNDPSYTCNTCGEFEHNMWKHGPHGPGQDTKWPTSWAPFDGDIMTIDRVPDDLTCDTLIAIQNNQHTILHKTQWIGDELIKTDFDGNVKHTLKHLNITHGRLATVDYHA